MTKTHQAIAQALIDNGVGVMSGLIGDANLYLVDSYVRDCEGRFVSAASEDAPVYRINRQQALQDTPFHTLLPRLELAKSSCTLTIHM